MSLTRVFEETVKYLTEAFARIFGPHAEDLPDIGVQPFECDPLYGNSEGKE